MHAFQCMMLILKREKLKSTIYFLYFIIVWLVFFHFVLHTDKSKHAFDSVIILGKARSGSSLMTTLLTLRDSFYFNEPIISLYNTKTNDINVNETNVIRDLLQCKFRPAFVNAISFRSQMFTELCSETYELEFCKRTREIVQGLCGRSKFITIKTVWLKLEDAVKSILLSQSNTGILYLIRDPRAITASRAEYQSVLKEKTLASIADNHTVLCNRMKSELLYIDSEINLKRRVHLVRYEDLIHQPFQTAKAIYKFLGREYNSKVENLVSSKLIVLPMRSNVYNLISTDRHSASRPAAWKKYLTFDIVLEVQRDCQFVLERLNYKFVRSKNDLYDDSFQMY